jgi:branched-chain amino acid transport system substrate-binding protein
MSGPEKSAGEHAQHGIRIAVAEVNTESDPVLGRKIAVRHADAHSDGHDAEAQAVRLVSVNKVAALLGATDAVQAEHLARGADSAGVPVVLQAALPRAASNENAYSCTASLSRRGQVLAWFVARDGLKVHPVAMLVDERSSAAGAIADAFTRELPKDHMLRLGFKDTKEFADLLARAAKGNPEALLVVGDVHDLPQLRAEQEKTGLAVPLIFGGEDGALPALLADRPTGDLVYLATSYLASDAAARNELFVKKYEEQFHEPPDVHAALAYDGACILFEALRAANTTNAPKVREALPELKDFESVTGPLSFAKDHHARRPLFVVQVKDGQAALSKRYEPDDQ